jgi:hypothetical protein
MSFPLKHGYLYRIHTAHKTRTCIGIFNDIPRFSGFDVVKTIHYSQNPHIYAKILSYELINHPAYPIQKEWKRIKNTTPISEIGPTPFTSSHRWSHPRDTKNTLAKQEYIISQQRILCKDCTCDYSREHANEIDDNIV